LNSSGKNIGVGKPLLSAGDLSNPGIESVSPALQADFLPLGHQGSCKQNIPGDLPMIVLYTGLVRLCVPFLSLRRVPAAYLHGNEFNRMSLESARRKAIPLWCSLCFKKLLTCLIWILAQIRIIPSEEGGCGEGGHVFLLKLGL